VFALSCAGSAACCGAGNNPAPLGCNLSIKINNSHLMKRSLSCSSCQASLYLK